MGLIKQTEQQYYGDKKSFTGDGTTLKFTLSTSQPTFPASYHGCADCVTVYIDGDMLAQTTTDSGGVVTTNWEFLWDTIDYWYLDFSLGTVPADGAIINVEKTAKTKTNNYQFTSLENVINNFMIAYTGEDKIVSKVNRTDVQFYAMRALQELSFDTFRSCKSQEIEIPSTLTMMLPQDYVNYIKLTWKDGSGIERIIYPTSKTSNPKAIKQDSNGEYSFDIDGDGFEDTNSLISPENSDTWASYKSGGSSAENTVKISDAKDTDIYDYNKGQRYGIHPQYAQANGSYFIDCNKGMIHFSSNISGKTVILHYISDSLGTDAEMQVHKLAEEAMYKWIIYSVLSVRANIPEYVVQRYKKEKFSETRKAKLRLSNIKLEEITQILRGKSKFIKH